MFTYIALLFITPYSLAGDKNHLPDYMAEATISLSVITKKCRFYREIETQCSFGRLVHIYKTTRCHNPEKSRTVNNIVIYRKIGGFHGGVCSVFLIFGCDVV